jgi:DNA-binding NtrC family response regulator
MRGGRQVRTQDIPQAIVARPEREARRGRKARSSAITLDLNEGMEALARQIVEAALELEGGNKQKAAERLRISARTVQRYVASGRVIER